MNTSNGHFTTGTSEIGLAAAALQSLLPAFEEHNEQTQKLSDAARTLASVPHDERIDQLRDLLLRYSELIQRIDEEHQTVIPQFREHVNAAVKDIETELGGPSSTNLNRVQLTSLFLSLEMLRKSLRETQSAVAYFRGTLSGMPDLGLEEVSTIRRQVEKSLEMTWQTFTDLGERLWKLRNRLVHLQ